MVTCQRGSRGCLSTGHRLARACRQAGSFGPTSSWARCSTTHYLTHPQLLDLAEEMGRFETLTLVLGYCGCRFGEAAALRRKDVGDREITVRASATYVPGQGIVVTDTKTKWSRRVPVPEPVWERLRGERPTDSTGHW